jgi:hypothetical protein
MCFGLFRSDAELKALQERLDAALSSNAGIQSKLDTITKSAKEIIVQNTSLMEEHKKILAEDAVIRAAAYMTGTAVPSWLDTTQVPYEPSIRIEENNQVYHVNIRAQDMYAYSPSLMKAVLTFILKGKTDDETFRNIWKFVITRCEYRYDLDESWEFAVVTFFRMMGDCEDTTILFTVLCRLCGIPADKIFNAVGWYRTGDGQNVGHSYPIVLLSDGKWYIMETTLTNWSDSYNAKLFKGSQYTADWGVANWIHAGKIRTGLQI